MSERNNRNGLKLWLRGDETGRRTIKCSAHTPTPTDTSLDSHSVRLLFYYLIPKMRQFFTFFFASHTKRTKASIESSMWLGQLIVDTVPTDWLHADRRCSRAPNPHSTSSNTHTTQCRKMKWTILIVRWAHNRNIHKIDGLVQWRWLFGWVVAAAL